MVQYNPKDWFKFVFQLHRADTFRKLVPFILAVGAYSGIIAWLEMEYWKLSQSSYVKNLTLIHSTLGLVISMLLVFRTNTAYERWWEGRKLWGNLVNSSRNFMLKLKALLPEDHDENLSFFRVMIPNYAYSLKNHLRGKLLKSEFESHSGFSPDQLVHNRHIPNQLAFLMMQRLMLMERQGLLKPEHLLLLNAEINNFTDVCGGCERIHKTPIPFSYSIFLKKFILIYVFTLPFGYVFSLGYLVIPVVGLIFYVLASLEMIAEEIEDPFGNDANDLPTDEISAGIRRTVREEM